MSRPFLPPPLCLLALAVPLLLAGFAVAPLPAGALEPVTLELPGSAIRYGILSFRTGSAEDPRGREGLAAVCAELIGRAVERALAERAADSGARLHWHADRERVTFRFKCHRDTFAAAWRVVAPLLARPPVNADTCRAAVDALRLQRERSLASAERLAAAALERHAHRGHPYGNPVFGTAASLAAIGPTDLRRALRDRFSRSRLILGVAADGTAPVLAETRRALAALPEGTAAPPPVPPLPEPDGLRVLLVRRALPAAAVAFGFPHPVDRAHPDRAALLVANAGFGEHRALTGLLFQELRGVRGLNYGNYSYIERFVEADQDKMPLPGIAPARPAFTVWIRSLDERNAVFALRYALDALERLPRTVSAPEFLARNGPFYANYLRLFAYDPFQRLGFLMDDAAFGAPDFFRATPERIAALSPEALGRAVAIHLAPAERSAWVAIACADPEAIRAQLLGESPCDPVYGTRIPDAARADDARALARELRITRDAIEIVDAEELF